MNAAFGGPVRVVGDASASAVNPAEAMDRVRAALAGLSADGEGVLYLHRPAPTAAFARRDTILPGYAAAAAAVAAHGFEPVLRPTGGRLSAYDEGALVLDIVASHPDPRGDPIARFRLIAELIAATLAGLGVDARVGPVPDEFCPGEHSVNAGGRRKLVGIAQRVGSRGYHLGAVIMVERPERARAAMAAAYPLLGLPLDPASVGAVAEEAPGVGAADIMQALLRRIEDFIPLVAEA